MALVAQLDATRVVEGVIGLVLLATAAVIVAVAGVRWQRERAARSRDDPGRPALARVGGPMVNPTVFGGGFPAARSVRRQDTVAHGYLAVAEEYVSDDDATHWCTLSVRLPGRVPELVVDHRSALNRPDVPGRAGHRRPTGDADFDARYLVGAQDADTPTRVLTAGARRVLTADAVQRLVLRDASVQVRTFDGAELTDGLADRLAGVVGEFLASTPSFVTYAKAPVGSAAPAPLPPGLYGLAPEPGLA